MKQRALDVYIATQKLVTFVQENIKDLKIYGKPKVQK